MPATKHQTEPSTISDLPVWARATALLGVPTIISLYLVWMLSAQLQAKIDAHTIEMREGATRQLQILSQICANTARTDEERAGCWKAAQR